MISACLLGEKCRYNGAAKPVPGLREKLAAFELFPFCPETLGGLPVPRPPAEISGAGGGAAVLEGRARVVFRTGRDCTAEFMQGAAETRNMARQLKPMLIICKAHSPSCGAGIIYDGAFGGNRCAGDGVAVAILRGEGIPIITEDQINQWLDQSLEVMADK